MFCLKTVGLAPVGKLFLPGDVIVSAFKTIDLLLFSLLGQRDLAKN